MIYQGGLRHVKNTIIMGLRAFFNNPSNYSNLLPSNLPVTVFSNMGIYDTHPQQLRTFPMIVVSGSSGRMVSGDISNDFALEVRNEYNQLVGYKYGGMYEFSVEIKIGTKTTLEREVLMDVTTSALRFSLRRRMEYHGVLIKETSYGGENKIQYDSDFIYTSLISNQVFSEWYEYFELLPVKEIDINQAVYKPKATAKSHYIGDVIKPSTYYDPSPRNILNWEY